MLQLVGIKNALGRKTEDKQSENTLKALFDISSMKQHLVKCIAHWTTLLFPVHISKIFRYDNVCAYKRS